MPTRSLLNNDKPKSILIDLNHDTASRINTRHTTMSLGETSLKYTVVNCCTFPIVQANRMGFTVPLPPSDFKRLTELGLGRVYQGNGVYIMVECNVNGWAAREMMHHYAVDCAKTGDNSFFDNRLYRKIMEAIKEKWLGRFKEGRVAWNAPGLHASGAGEVNYRYLFFIAEHEFETTPTFYEHDLDLTFTKRAMEPKFYHPNFNEDLNVYKEFVKEAFIEKGNTESILLATKNPSKIYRKVGADEQVYTSIERTLASEDGLYYQYFSVGEDGEPYFNSEFIKLSDKERLRKHGFFLSLEEAKHYNSEIEISKLRNAFALKEQEHKTILYQMENQHKEELARIKLEEAKIKLVETQTTVEEKTVERAHNEEMRVIKKQEHQEDRQEKLEDKELNYREKALESQMKMSEMQMRMAAKGSEETSRNLASTAAIITGAGAIGMAVAKLAQTASKEFAAKAAAKAATKSASAVLANALKSSITKQVSTKAASAVAGVVGKTAVKHVAAKVATKAAASAVAAKVGASAAAGLGTAAIVGKGATVASGIAAGVGGVAALPVVGAVAAAAGVAYCATKLFDWLF